VLLAAVLIAVSTTASTTEAIGDLWPHIAHLLGI